MIPSSLQMAWTVDTEPVADLGLDGQRPRGVHPGAERGQDGDAPVADLVTEALDHQLAVGREQPAGRLLLLGQVGPQVADGQLVEVALGGQLARPIQSPTSAVKPPMARPSS